MSADISLVPVTTLVKTFPLENFTIMNGLMVKLCGRTFITASGKIQFKTANDDDKHSPRTKNCLSFQMKYGTGM